MNKEKKYPGIIWGGIYFCLVHALWLFSNWSNYDYYRQSFQFISDGLIPWRYCFSVFLRVVSIICGLGIILHKNVFRKLLLLICIFNIVTIYWKHPLYILKNIENNFLLLMPLVVPPWVETIAFSFSTILLFVRDFIVFGWFIYYFTRPGVKAQFK